MNITTQATAAREAARRRDGRFGAQARAEVDLELDRAPRRRIRRGFAAAALAGLTLTTSACQIIPDSLEDYVGGSPIPTISQSRTHDAHIPETVTGAALDTLNTLRVRSADEDGGVKYDRQGQFQRSESESWLPTEGNCDTRDYVLARDLTTPEFVSGSSCDVGGGTLHDAYTMNEVYQPFGPREKVDEAARPFTNIDIEHVVSLGDAWISGAGTWEGAEGQDKRVALANDPMNLLAASAQANTSKSDSSFDQWPARAPEGMFNEGYTCDLAARQIYVKAKYDLSVTEDEHDALADALESCPSGAAAQPLPEQEGLWWNQPQPDLSEFATIDGAPASTSPAPATSSPTASAASASAGQDSVEFENCAQVWEANGGPIRSGEPGFSTRFDGDGDGVGCEARP